jgi:hypothetical protein
MWDDIDDPLRFEWTHKFASLFFSLRDHPTPVAEQQCGLLIWDTSWSAATPGHRPRIGYQVRRTAISSPPIALNSAAAFPDSLGGGGCCGLRGMAGR